MIDHVVTLGEGLGVFRSGPDAPLWNSGHAQVSTGGAEANVAMAVGRLGVPVTWLGRVGDDWLGRRVVRELRGEGVTVLDIVDPSAPTGLLVKEQHADGRTQVIYYRRGSAGSALDGADVDRLDLGPGTLLHVTGITPALSETARAAIERLFDRAGASQALVSFDVNHRGRLWSAEQASPVYRDWARRADILFASVEEVPLLLPGWSRQDPEHAADALADDGHDHVIVTAGADGAFARVGAERYRAPAIPVRVVDTVGAGDAFVGGYLAGLAQGRTLAERLRLASILGAAACRHPGDWEGVADLSGLEGGPEGDQVSR